MKLMNKKLFSNFNRFISSPIAIATRTRISNSRTKSWRLRCLLRSWEVRPSLKWLDEKFGDVNILGELSKVRKSFWTTKKSRRAIDCVWKFCISIVPSSFLVENPKHSDFVKLRTMLISTHMQDLKDVTQDVHYENFRAQCISQISQQAIRERRYLRM